MKKIIYSFLISFFLVIQAFADFGASYSNISGPEIFMKNSGIDELRVSEDYFINPFGSSVIKENITVCTGNNCPCGSSGCSYTSSYSVDGTIFNSSHAKYKSANATRRNWYNYDDGIVSRVEYKQNTYTTAGSVEIPRQSVKVRRYYITTYQHDTSLPTCSDVKYYNDEALTTDFTYAGGWLNEPKYFTMTCFDGQTDCACDISDDSCLIKSGKVISTPQLLGHNIKPQVNFTNKVKLTDPTCEPGGSFQSVLFDLKTPKTDIRLGGKGFDLNQENLRNYKTVAGKLLDGIETPGILSFTRSGSVDRLAGDTLIDLELEDSYLPLSVHGVSGLKSYDFSISRLTDQSFNTISTEIVSCGQSETITTSYNIDGSLVTSDIKDKSFNCNELRVSGKYEFIFEAYDWAGNKSLSETIVNIYPDDISIPDSSLLITNPGDTIYANNIDRYNYELILKDKFGNPIYDRVFDNPTQSITAYSGGDTITLGDTTTALRYNYDMSSYSNDGRYLFSIRSLLPGDITQRILLTYNQWDDGYSQNGSNKSIYITNNNTSTFNKPITANMVFQGPGSNLEVGTVSDYQIDLTNIGNIASITNRNLDINTTTLNFTSGHEFSQLTNVDNTFTLANLQSNFSGVFDAISASSVLQAPELEITNMNINYRLSGKNISYPLDTFGIIGQCSISTVGLKTIGTTQGDGKGEITGGADNFSDVSTSVLRSQIRENAYRLIRGLNSGDTVNGVRYIEGDTTISGNPSYETLIVKNGNVFISGDLNIAGSTLGIIVLRDTGYNILSDYNTQGNIYVGNNVTTINAQLYADGALRSALVSGADYTDGLLGVKLRMKGSLFTRNTIGGGLLAGGNYLLPGGGVTSDIDLASTYDLNSIRRAQECGDTDDYSFLIEYDPRVQTDPPIGFQTN